MGEHSMGMIAEPAPILRCDGRARRSEETASHRRCVPEPHTIQIIFPLDDPREIRVGATLLLALERLMSDPAIRLAVQSTQALSLSRPSPPSPETAGRRAGGPGSGREGTP
jgi:hypothetical protein